MAGILDYLDEIASDVHIAAQWQDRKTAILNGAKFYDDPTNLRNITTGIALYPGIPFGVLDSIARSGQDFRNPAITPLIASSYQRELEAGNYRNDTTAPSYAAGQANKGTYNTQSSPDNAQSMEDQLKQEGFVDKNGNLVRPTPKRYSESRGWYYNSASDEAKDKKFFQIVDEIAKSQSPDKKNPDNLIPYIDPIDGRSVFYPKTGLTSADPTAVKAAGRGPGLNFSDLPVIGSHLKGLDAGLANARNHAVDWISNYHSTVHVPGTPQPNIEGFSSQPSIKDDIRFGSEAAYAPLQEVVGAGRSLYQSGLLTPGRLLSGDYQPPHFTAQSDLMLHLRNPQLSTGSGFFIDPESEVARKRRQVESQFGQIRGHNMTAGRMVGNVVGNLIPNQSVDDVAYNMVSGGIDAAIQMYADPVAAFGGEAAKLSEAKRIFIPENYEEEAGLFKGLRNTFNGTKWSAFTETPHGTAVLDALTNYNDTVPGATRLKLWQIMGQQHDPQLIDHIFNTHTRAETYNLMRDVIGTQIRNTNELSKIPGALGDEALMKLYTNTSQGLRESRLTSRFFDFLPANSFKSSSRLDTATQLMRFGKLGGMNDESLAFIFDKVAKGQYKEDNYRAMIDMMDMEQGVLENAGVASKAARRTLTQAYSKNIEDALHQLQDEVASDTPLRDNVLINGQNVQSIKAELLLEHLQDNVPLPDINRIRRAMRDPKYRWLTTKMNPEDIGQQRWPAASVLHLTEDYWKPLMLVGRFPAWVSRVVGEEQLRMVTAGLDNVFNHPISAFSSVIGKGNVSPKVSVAGNEWDDVQAMQDALVRGNGGNIRRAGGTRNVPKMFSKLDAETYDQYVNAWANQLAAVIRSPETNQMMNSNVEETVNWLFRGDQAEILGRLRAAEPGKFNSKADALNWFENVLADRVHVLTGDDPELIDALKTQQFRGQSVFDDKGAMGVNKKFKRALYDKVEESGPLFVKGFEPTDSGYMRKQNAAVDWLFSHTMTPATNKFSRGSASHQYQWRHAIDMAPFATKDVQDAMLANAEKAGLSNRMMKALKFKTRTAGDKIDSIEMMEELSSGYAVDSTKRLLYDFSRRGLVSEQIKLLSPFANAYQELLSTYPKIILGKQYGLAGKIGKAVQVSSVANKIIRGARANGWFMKNQFGDEVFTFPFTEGITSALAGAPVPLTGSVKGLNMVGSSVFPGVGPAAAIPLASILDGKPGAWHDVEQFILPYGAPGEKNPTDLFNIFSYTPAWMAKAALAASQGPPPGLDKVPGANFLWPSKAMAVWDNNSWMSSQVSVMQYLATTGNYDLSTRQGLMKIQEDARRDAKNLWWIRAGMQFFAPTAPQFNFLAQDKRGNLVAQEAVAHEFYAHLADHMSLDDASMAILKKYGPQMFSMVVPHTRAITYAIPRTREAGEWVDAHQKIVEQFPASYGFFAPQHGTFDYSVVVRQIAKGNTKVLTPSAWLNLRNETLKTMALNYVSDQIGNSPTQQQTNYLRNIRIQLDDELPSSTVDIPQKPSTDEVIKELQDAVQVKELANTNAGKGIAAYLQARDIAMNQAKAYDPNLAGFQSSQALYGTRQWLSQVGHQIMSQDKDFETVWNSVFSRELDPELR